MAKKIKIKTNKPKLSHTAVPFNAALRYYQSGDIKQAEIMCGQMLQREPGNPEGLHLMGLIAGQAGRYDDAIHLISRAIHINPHKYSYYNNLGLALKFRKRLDDAVESFKKAIELKPDFAGAYNNLGIAFADKGMMDDAIKNFKKVLELSPDFVEAIKNLGDIYKSKGMKDEAIESYKKLLKIKPDFAEAYFNIGFLLEGKGLVDEAIENYRKALAIRADHAETYNNLGNAFRNKGLVDEAIENYGKALRLKPDYADAYSNLGNALSDKGMIDEAIESYRKALLLKPDYAEMYNNLGLAFKEKGLLDEAIDNLESALKLKPDYALAYNNLGTILVDKGMIDEAIEKYEQALKLNSDYNEAYNNLGVALREKGMIDEAIENYKKALILNPDFAMAYNNLAITIEDKGMIDEAIEAHKKALMLKPDNAKMHQNLGMTYLLARDFEKGWEEYEWRLKTFKAAPLTKPKWDGSSLENRTILVYAEQGYGDSLQFVRYLPELYDEFAAKKVLFIPRKGLEQLLKDSDLKAEILDASSLVETLEYDTNIHLLSLPQIFRTNLENIPFRHKRYLKANPDKVTWYKENYFIERKIESAEVRKSGNEEDGKHRSDNDLPLAPCHLSLKIGIFWQGNPALPPDRRRSMPFHHLYPLCRLSGVKIYSLQKGFGLEQLNNLPEDIEITNLGETFNDFSDTAAAIENLDLMITVDTAIGHLSGALGKKTWILLPSHAEWRWHLDMDHSPWYEDVRLFRHKESGKKDWNEMMERVVEELKKACSV